MGVIHISGREVGEIGGNYMYVTMLNILQCSQYKVWQARGLDPPVTPP